MLSSKKLNRLERMRTLRQKVADTYTWLWDFFWLPIRFIANRQWLTKLFPAQWRPFLFGARLGRWPQKINDDHYTLCCDSNCETCTSLQPGELDIDHAKETTHDPFGILATLRRQSTS